jgi:hypothetical protein
MTRNLPGSSTSSCGTAGATRVPTAFADLYASLPHTPSCSQMAPAPLFQAADRAAATDLVAGRLSATGEHSLTLLAGSPGGPGRWARKVIT